MMRADLRPQRSRWRRIHLAFALAGLVLPGRASPAPAVYGPEPAVILTPSEVQAIDLARARFSAGGARPEVSGTLVVAARLLAEEASGGGDPTRRQVIRNALARALAYDPAAMPYSARGAPDALPGALERAIGPGVGSATHVGAGVVARDGTQFAVILTSTRGARLEPFPQRVTLGARAEVSGQLRAGLCDARVFVTSPSGAVREIPAPRGVWFRANVPFVEAGRHTVEVLADGPHGPTVAALFPVVAGEGAIEEPAPGARGAATPDPDRPEEAVLEALQTLRAQRGLPRLEVDPRLAEIARRHSEAMRTAGTVAHVVPGSPGPEARLRAARVSWRGLFENVAASSTAIDAHEATAASPAHLRNMLEPRIRRVGIGVAQEVSPSGRTRVYLTEIFVE